MPYACGNARIEVESIILAVTWDEYAATRTATGVIVAWTTLAEDDTLGFEIRAMHRDGSEAVVMTLPAHGPSQPYELRDSRDVARDGTVTAYRVTEIRWDGRRGDATPWFKIARDDGGTRGARATGGRTR